MKTHELTIGRTLGVTFDHGDDFYPSLAEACRRNNITQGYIPMFIAGLSTVRIVGACDKLDDPAAPVWSAVHLTNVEAIGAGTIAYNPDDDTIWPHIHINVGSKEQSAIGHTSHLLEATVQFLTEMIIVEVTSPVMTRIPQPALYNVPLLNFEQPTQPR